MKTEDVAAVSVDWMEGYGNDPDLVIHLKDGCGIHSDFTYEGRTVKNGTMYFAERENEVRFMLHTPKNESGYGGAEFNLNMSDDTQRVVKGPWSSNAFAARHFVAAEIVTLVVVPGKGAEYAGCRLSCHLLLDFVNELLVTYFSEFTMYEGDYGWYPVMKGFAPNNPRRKA